METTNKQWIYKRNKNNIEINKIEEEIGTSNIDEKINLIVNLRKNKNHDRFYIK